VPYMARVLKGYVSASAVVIHYEEALYQVYAPLPLPFTFTKVQYCYPQEVFFLTLTLQCCSVFLPTLHELFCKSDFFFNFADVTLCFCVVVICNSTSGEAAPENWKTFPWSFTTGTPMTVHYYAQFLESLQLLRFLWVY